MFDLNGADEHELRWHAFLHKLDKRKVLREWAPSLRVVRREMRSPEQRGRDEADWVFEKQLMRARADGLAGRGRLRDAAGEASRSEFMVRQREAARRERALFEEKWTAQEAVLKGRVA